VESLAVVAERPVEEAMDRQQRARNLPAVFVTVPFGSLEADELDLRLKLSEEETRLDFMLMLTVQTMNYLHSGRHRVAL
jgi:hypothetical protein